MTNYVPFLPIRSSYSILLIRRAAAVDVSVTSSQTPSKVCELSDCQSAFHEIKWQNWNIIESIFKGFQGVWCSNVSLQISYTYLDSTRILFISRYNISCHFEVKKVRRRWDLVSGPTWNCSDKNQITAEHFLGTFHFIDYDFDMWRVTMRPKRVYLRKRNKRNDSVIALICTTSIDTVKIVRFLSNGHTEKKNGEQNRRRALFRVLFVFIRGKCGGCESRKSFSLCRRTRWNVRPECEIMQSLLFMRKRSRCKRREMSG